MRDADDDEKLISLKLVRKLDILTVLSSLYYSTKKSGPGLVGQIRSRDSGLSPCSVYDCLSKRVDASQHVIETYHPSCRTYHESLNHGVAAWDDRDDRVHQVRVVNHTQRCFYLHTNLSANNEPRDLFMVFLAE